MLAAARALAGGPKVLLPGRAALRRIRRRLSSRHCSTTLIKIRDETGVTIILIEQKAELALAFANDCIVIDRGKIVHRGPSAALRADTELQAGCSVWGIKPSGVISARSSPRRRGPRSRHAGLRVRGTSGAKMQHEFFGLLFRINPDHFHKPLAIA